MKKIVFLIYGFANSGVERRVVLLSNELSKRGYHIEIVAAQGVCDSIYFHIEKNVKLVSVDEIKRAFHYVDTSLKKQKTNKGPSNTDIQNERSALKNSQNGKSRKIRKILPGVIRKRNNYFSSCISVMRFNWIYRKYCLSIKPDIIVGFGMYMIERIMFAARGMNCMILDAETNAHERFYSNNKKRQKWLLSHLNKADGIIVQTRSEKEYFDKFFQNVFVINNPIMPNLPQMVSGKRQKRIVNFCRITPQKNIVLLVEAFSLFHKDYPDYALEIYGNTTCRRETEYKERIINKIKEKGLQDSAIILPSVADIHDRVLDSAMFVSSSDYEGLSNSMLEAMAIGLPCVCTDCLGGGVREVMTDHVNGLVVPMNDPNALYHAMKEYVENPDLALTCSRNAVKIRKKLSIEKIADKWIEVFEQ